MSPYILKYFVADDTDDLMPPHHSLPSFQGIPTHLSAVRILNV